MRDLFIFALGWAAGAGVMWGYFVAVGMLRTRREYYAWRKRNGYVVPEDWEDDAQ